MLSNDLQKMLADWCVKHSGHDFKRSYIGLSGIYRCEREIYDELRNGRKMGMPEHFRTRLTFEVEAALQERLRMLGVYLPGETITLYDGLVQGHTDGVIDGRDVLEIKTVQCEEHLPRGLRVPERVYWQVQGYMHYLKRRRAHVLYFARDNGWFKVIGIGYEESTGRMIEAKVERLVEAVRECEAPLCSCGRCGEVHRGDAESAEKSFLTTENTEFTEKS